MPNTSLNANNTRNKREKNVSMVKKAISSSLVHQDIDEEEEEEEEKDDDW